MEREYVEYHKLVLNNIHEYLADTISEQDLIKVLREVEHNIQETVFVGMELDDDIDEEYNTASLWFRLFEGDNLVNTIRDIEEALKLPVGHPNHKWITDSLILATENKGKGLKIYYS